MRRAKTQGGSRKKGRRGGAWDWGEMMQENRPCNDIDEEEEGGESVSRKRKRRESVSPLSRLIKRCRNGSKSLMIPHYKEDPDYE